MFIPRHPYVPLGTLRGALAYPSPQTAYSDEQIMALLQSTGLNRLCSSLDRIARWDREPADGRARGPSGQSPRMSGGRKPRKRRIVGFFS